MQIKQAEFVTSIAEPSALTDFGAAEIAVAGKSNVGKSSLINFLTNRIKLAKTSQEPGRTRLINFFSINQGEFYLVDLPGYGFARVSDAEKKKWGKLIEAYLQTSKQLKNVFLLVDIRNPVTQNDEQMIRYFYYYNIPFTIIATKCDKLSRTRLFKRKRELASELKVGEQDIILSSASARLGKEDLLLRIEQILNN